MKKVVCDIETDGIENCQHIWCCVCRDADTDAVTVFREGDAEDARSYFNSVDRVIGHNFISFDGCPIFGIFILILIISSILWCSQD